MINWRRSWYVHASSAGEFEFDTLNRWQYSYFIHAGAAAACCTNCLHDFGRCTNIPSHCNLVLGRTISWARRKSRSRSSRPSRTAAVHIFPLGPYAPIERFDWPTPPFCAD